MTKHTYDKKIIKPQQEKQKENDKEEIYNEWENKIQNGNKYVSISNYHKCQWTECSNQNT